ncbi:MAG: hypothetical protein IPM77_14500 [Crocinitomicaceae bacterium]|nr:hypothetical protein [Crocinitomicaceae bacterium]
MNSNKISVFLKIFVALLALYTLWTLIISIRELFLPVEHHSEFDALKNFSQGITLIVICIFTVLLLICTLLLLKLKKWAFIVSIILLFLLIPLTDLVQTPDLMLHISDGNTLAVLKEIIPVVLVALLLSRFKEFWPKKN